MKDKEFLEPGYIMIPLTFEAKPPEIISDVFTTWGSSTIIKFKPKKKYNILKVKDWLNSKKLLSRYAEKKINSNFYQTATITIKKN